MARNLSDLQITIKAKIDDFKAKLNDATKDAKGFKSTVSDSFGKMSESISKVNPVLGEFVSKLGGAGAAGGGLLAIPASMTAIGLQAAYAAKEIAMLSGIAGAGTAEFQTLAAGAAKYGVTQEQLADQLKDFREKMGEFASTGSGPMKDFFETIGPKVGVTIKDFQNLSGPEALGLYAKSLEKAGVSQEQMSWYLESMGSDLTKLIPLYANNGKELNELGKYAKDVGAIMSDDLIKSSEGVTEGLGKSGQAFSGMVNIIAGDAMPTLNKLIVIFNDSMVALQPYIKAISTGLGYAFRGIVVAGYGVIRIIGGITGAVGSLAGAAFALMTGNVSDAVGLAKQAGAQIVSIYDDIKNKGADILLDTKNVQTEGKFENKKKANNNFTAFDPNKAKDAAKAGKEAAKAADELAKKSIDAQKEFVKLYGDIDKSNIEAASSLSEYSGLTQTQIDMNKAEIKLQEDLNSIRSNDKLNANQKAMLEEKRMQANELQKAIILAKSEMEGNKALNEEVKNLKDSYISLRNAGKDLTDTQQKLIELEKTDAWRNASEETRQAVNDQAARNIELEKELKFRQEIYALTGKNEKGQTALDIKKEKLAKLDKEFADPNGSMTQEQYDKAKANINDIKLDVITLENIASDAAGGMADAFIAFAQGSKNSFADFARSFLANITKMIIQTQILNAMKQAQGSADDAGGWGNLIVKGIGMYSSGGSSTGYNGWDGSVGTTSSGGYWANGGAFQGGSVIPFANGGVVDSPTNFGMSGNRIGLMGEAGQEGILPLKRINGKLGVMTDGIGGNQTINQVTINVTGGNTNEETGNIVAEKVMRAIARSEISNQRRPGGQLNPI